jgi:hypothetical protein
VLGLYVAYYKLTPVETTFDVVLFVLAATPCVVISVAAMWFLLFRWNELTWRDRWRFIFYAIV